MICLYLKIPEYFLCFILLDKFCLCSYGSNSFSHDSQWITSPTQPCLVLYSFCANLLHSLIMWLIVSSLLPHNLHLLFGNVFSILALIWLVLRVLFCAAIRRDPISLYYYFHYCWVSPIFSV